MLYVNHGINYCFTGRLHEYFNDNVDLDASIYIMMANYLTHTLLPVNLFYWNSLNNVNILI